jgi:DNA polymerase-3 subunit delta
VILKGRAEIERFIKGPSAAFRSALIYGRDLGVVRERAGGLAGAVTERPDDPFDVALLNQSELEGEPARLEDELSAISMMGGRRLVRLRLTEDKGGALQIAADTLADHLAGRLNPEAFLIIEAPLLAKDSVLRKGAERAPACGVIACYEDEPGDMKLMVRQALAGERLALSSEALDIFVSRLPHDRGVARSEIERLALFLGPGAGKTAGPAELESFLGVEPEASLAAAADDAFGGRLAAAHAGLRRAAMEIDVGSATVRVMGMHLLRLRRVLTQREAGADLQSAARSAGVFWKNEREFLRQARSWTLPTLDSIQAELLAADRACKRAGSPADLIAQRLALSIAARAQRLGL